MLRRNGAIGRRFQPLLSNWHATAFLFSSLHCFNHQIALSQSSLVTKKSFTSTARDTPSTVMQCVCINDELKSLLLRIDDEDKLPTVEELLNLAEALTRDHGSDFRTLINYRLALDKLMATDHFQKYDFNLWQLFSIRYAPFLKGNKLENYNERSTLAIDFMKYVESLDESSRFQQELDVFKKLAYTIIVDLIKDSILLGDKEYSIELLGVYHSQYLMTDTFQAIPSEDFHTFLDAAIKNPVKDVLEILTSMTFLKSQSVPLRMRSDLMYELSKIGLIEQYIRVYNSKVSQKQRLIQLLQLFSHHLSTIDTFRLLDVMLRDSSQNLSFKDIQFISNSLKKEIIDSSLQRKEYTPIEASMNRPKRVSVQRVDINNILSVYSILNESPNEISINTKKLLANCLLCAVSEVTNTTGLIHLYLKLPIGLLDEDSFEIMTHALSRGDFDSHLLRVDTIWRHLKTTELVTPKSLEFLIEFSLKVYRPDMQHRPGKRSKKYDVLLLPDRRKHAGALISDLLAFSYSRFGRISDRSIYLLVNACKFRESSSLSIKDDIFESLFVSMDASWEFEQVNEHFRQIESQQMDIPLKCNEFDIKESRALKKFHSIR